MNDENTERLFKHFPRLFRGKDLPLTQNLMPFGFECGDGWYDLVYSLAADISKYAAKANLDPIAVQVKEKLGGLRFYVHRADDHIFKLVANAESRSFRICDRCGARGKRVTIRGWIATRCAAHAK